MTCLSRTSYKKIGRLNEDIKVNETEGRTMASEMKGKSKDEMARVDILLEFLSLCGTGVYVLCLQFQSVSE